eukprot:TRINITY_DN1859_c0_g1_i1.p1 TRINITY_DN1859_c0_g1~~TRINITY_DN1859_c0_g1_i1.p1  ORF type:complete len:111 (+),score=17.04 TRINITY_DN1859_c0_g1_i1:1074-1406(+)
MVQCACHRLSQMKFHSHWYACTNLLQVRLPATLRRLTLGEYSNRSGVHLMLKNGLPPKLEEFVVVWYSDFNAALTQFPPTLHVLRLNKSFNAPLEDIPAGLQEAILPECK